MKTGFLVYSAPTKNISSARQVYRQVIAAVRRAPRDKKNIYALYDLSGSNNNLAERKKRGRYKLIYMSSLYES